MTAEQLRKSILQEAISGRLVPQDPNDEPAIELLKRLNPKFIPCDNSHYGNIPESWCVTKLGEVYNHTTGKALKKSNTVGVLRDYLTTSNVYWNSFDFTEVRSMYFSNDELEKCTVQEGDLLVCNGGDVGRAAIWNYDYSVCYQNHIHRLRAYYPINTKFYYYVLYLYKMSGYIESLAKGMGIQGLSANRLGSFDFPLPPLKEQEEIVTKVETLLAKVTELENQIQERKTLSEKLAFGIIKEKLEGYIEC